MVLAIATFTAVRSSNRSARVAEESLLAGLRPLLIPSLTGDPVHKVLWSDRHVAKVEGGRAVAEQEGDVIYLVMGLRNVGTGIALLHAWYPWPYEDFGGADPVAPEDFRRLSIDLYVPAGGTGYWESALRDPDEPVFQQMEKSLTDREPFRIDLLYGDQQGSQRTISHFTVLPMSGDEGWYCLASRHWNVDRPPRR